MKHVEGRSYEEMAVLLETTVGALPKTTTSASIVFDGTSKAAVTITVNGVTSHCTVDLTSQSAALCTV